MDKAKMEELKENIIGYVYKKYNRKRSKEKKIYE